MFTTWVDGWNPAIQCSNGEIIEMVHYCYLLLYQHYTFFAVLFFFSPVGNPIDHHFPKSPKNLKGNSSHVRCPFPHGQSSCNHLVIEVMDRCIAAPATPLHRLTARWEFVDARHGTKWQQNQKERNKQDVKK